MTSDKEQPTWAREALARIDRYQDALPRRAGRAEDFGPLTLFVRRDGGGPLHARPSPGGAAARRAVRAADVERVRDRQRALGVPEVFEWVAESAPELREAAEEAGLTVQERPLLVFPADVPTPVAAARAVPAGISVRTVAADDPRLASAVAVAHLAFAELGTHVGTAGAAELAVAVRVYAPETARTAGQIRAGTKTVVAAVEVTAGGRAGGALSSGVLPGVIDGCTEISAVGTLPAARRRGLAGAVTARLVAEARELGARTVFLGATDETVARVYGRLGFRRVGTFLEAEPAR
ncbi:GNAT family N-acetyltransferase [Streptomyces sp. NBC_00370]|uniref:GNAT family N-acetyltransferase n=1 Tax=Streptomyces sp. NBC_00370 TaxID=2975728 RepID=UPI002E26545F